MGKSHPSPRGFAKRADYVARDEQPIQRQIHRAEEAQAGANEKSDSRQAGSQPCSGGVPPRQVSKPGQEAEIEPQPRYKEGHYKGSGKLRDKVAQITGGDPGIARSVAVFYARKGARVLIPVEIGDRVVGNPADKHASQVEKFGSGTPMRQAPQPEEIAPALIFMAAPSCSSYITGEILPAIAGYSRG